ncbi:cuticle protein 7-like [Oratosquilla oratoria]|uniref:cuticle protein 7-like n=1 Tax=Oratosquilla oratoria TaxID=337810 RepID=UPI003F772A28
MELKQSWRNVFLHTFLLVLTGVSLVDSQGYGYLPPRPVHSVYGTPQLPARYDFDYAVRDAYSGNDFGHQESRDGDHTRGSYYVLLPDGRTQRVNYRVDGDSGFVAEVTYEGEARPYASPSNFQPIYSSPSRETYSPPQPSYIPPHAYGK